MKLKYFFGVSGAVFLFLNGLALLKMNQLKNEVTYCKLKNNQSIEKEKGTHELFENSLLFSGKTLHLSDISMIENISNYSISPLLIVKKDVCNACKDNLYLEIEKLHAASLNMFNRLSIVLLDETPNTIGSGMEKFLKDNSCSLFYLKESEVFIGDENKLDDILLLIVNENMCVLSSCKYDINKTSQFVDYLRVINKQFFS